MRERVVRSSIAVGVPGIVEKHQIARAGSGPLMEPAVLSDVVVDQPDTVGLLVGRPTLVEVDPVLEKDGPRDTGAIVSDASAVHFDGVRSDQPRGAPHDGGTAGGGLDRSAATLTGSLWTIRLVSLDAGAADQRDYEYEASDKDFA